MLTEVNLILFIFLVSLVAVGGVSFIMEKRVDELLRNAGQWNEDDGELTPVPALRIKRKTVEEELDQNTPSNPKLTVPVPSTETAGGLNRQERRLQARLQSSTPPPTEKKEQ